MAWATLYPHANFPIVRSEVTRAWRTVGGEE
jgi:hypothetical protein